MMIGDLGEERWVSAAGVAAAEAAVMEAAATLF